MKYVVVRKSNNSNYSFTKFHDSDCEAVEEALRLSKQESADFMVLKVVGEAMCRKTITYVPRQRLLK